MKRDSLLCHLKKKYQLNEQIDNDDVRNNRNRSLPNYDFTKFNMYPTPENDVKNLQSWSVSHAVNCMVKFQVTDPTD